MKSTQVRGRVPRAVVGGRALVLGAGLTGVGVLPGMLLIVYLAVSALSFVLYGVDKAAARAGRPRTPEKVLHVVDLLGGWPGALLGQQAFHHKTSKGSYQAVFWATVAANISVCVWAVHSRAALLLARSVSG